MQIRDKLGLQFHCMVIFVAVATESEAIRSVAFCEWSSQIKIPNATTTNVPVPPPIVVAVVQVVVI